MSGGTAVALTIAAILAGKAIALDPAVDRGIAEIFTPEDHAQWMADAEAYPGTEDFDLLSTFIVDHSYGESGSEEEIEEFLASWGPRLEHWKAEKPTFETWQAGMIEEWKAENYAGSSWFDRYQEGFGLFDLIFMALGVTTAFKLAGRPEEVRVKRDAKSANQTVARTSASSRSDASSGTMGSYPSGSVAVKKLESTDDSDLPPR
jgi:hypothetical protein